MRPFWTPPQFVLILTIDKYPFTNLINECGWNLLSSTKSVLSIIDYFFCILI